MFIMLNNKKLQPQNLHSDVNMYERMEEKCIPMRAYNYGP